MSTSIAVAALIAIAMLFLCVLVRICLADTAPRQRPAILRALAEVLRSMWPTMWRSVPRDRSGNAQGELPSSRGKRGRPR